MIHATIGHELLADNDLTHHIPEYHGTPLDQVPDAGGDIEAWMMRWGLDSVGADLDRLLRWHEMQHSQDDAEHPIENALWAEVERAYDEERRYIDNRGALLPNVAGDRARRERARILQVQTETWLRAVAMVRLVEDQATSYEDHLLAVTNLFTEKLVKRTPTRAS